MKTLKITLEVECKDSTNVEDIVSDLQDSLLCDNIKHSTVEYEKNGTLETDEFENEDFEE